ncbi:MAG: threonylcarbamoyl-AMP synthase [Taibaiella sp.]|nr:threonylcarbamoyl-AMP synthase [Taibaiella sp.]
MNDRIGADVSIAARLLQEGKLVAMPTETVYGLAANALDAGAVRRIYEVKGRPSNNPLIVHVADTEQIGRYVAEMPLTAERLIAAFCPGPLTVVLPRAVGVPDVVTAGRDTVAIRVPAHSMARQLLQEAGLPLAAPSANPSGYISPTTAAHVWETLGNKVSYILDGGPCSAGIESTIVGFDGEVPVILRHGVVTREQILQVAGNVRIHSGTKILAPGMALSHYSPRTPLKLVDDPDQEMAALLPVRVGIITFDGYCGTLPREQQIVLSATGDDETAAKHLYAAMHDMDVRGYELIIVKLFPDKGVGVALNDRLERAAYGHKYDNFLKRNNTHNDSK